MTRERTTSSRCVHRASVGSPIVVRGGVTLLDISITVLVMGVLSAVALPKFAVVLESRRADATARRIAADLEYARRTAMTTSRNCSVQFLSSLDRYTMTGVPHPHRPGQNYAVTLSEISEGVQITNVDFDAGATLTYTVHGLPVVGTSPLVSGQLVVSSGSASRTLTIDPTTGKVLLP